eukprot:scaffold932_cov328-Pavlova_lutheri.AAC.53
MGFKRVERLIMPTLSVGPLLPSPHPHPPRDPPPSPLLPLQTDRHRHKGKEGDLPRVPRPIGIGSDPHHHTRGDGRGGHNGIRPDGCGGGEGDAPGRDGRTRDADGARNPGGSDGMRQEEEEEGYEVQGEGEGMEPAGRDVGSRGGRKAPFPRDGRESHDADVEVVDAQRRIRHATPRTRHRLQGGSRLLRHARHGTRRNGNQRETNKEPDPRGRRRHPSPPPAETSLPARARERKRVCGVLVVLENGGRVPEGSKRTHLDEPQHVQDRTVSRGEAIVPGEQPGARTRVSTTRTLLGKALHVLPPWKTAHGHLRSLQSCLGTVPRTQLRARAG